MVEFSRSGQAKQNKAGFGKKKLKHQKMTFTGTLIESLMATVERAERGASYDEPTFAQNIDTQPWFVSIQQSADYDSKFLGVA